jgi:hypothetical protein
VLRQLDARALPVGEIQLLADVNRPP